MTQISFKISLDSISFGKLPNTGVHFSAFVFDATVLVTSYIGQFHAWDNYTSIGIKLS